MELNTKQYRDDNNSRHREYKMQVPRICGVSFAARVLLVGVR